MLALKTKLEHTTDPFGKEKGYVLAIITERLLKGKRSEPTRIIGLYKILKIDENGNHIISDLKRPMVISEDIPSDTETYLIGQFNSAGKDSREQYDLDTLKSFLALLEEREVLDLKMTDWEIYTPPVIEVEEEESEG